MKIDHSQIWNCLRQSNTYEPQFYTDWIGIVWPDSSFPAIPIPSLSSTELPFNGDSFRAGQVEWEAFGFSIALAKSNPTATATAIELGSSASPWALGFIKVLVSEKEIETLSIEAGDVKALAKKFWEANHLFFKIKRRRKKFIFTGEKFTASFIRGLATNNSNSYFFPNVDVGRDNGATGASELASLDFRGLNKATKIKGIDVFEQVKKFESIDLLHMDIQGSELDLMLDPRFKSLAKKTKVMLIGTHSRQADILAHTLTKDYGLNLISFKESQPGTVDGKWPVDGEFFFLNDEALKISKNIGLFL
jgi:hypothetical protein